jgi:hypothetical protein
MSSIQLTELRSGDLTGPVMTQEGDLFRSHQFEILLSDSEGFPQVTLRSPSGEALQVIDEEGAALGEEDLSTLLWERLEGFDEVIERLAGPLPSP